MQVDMVIAKADKTGFKLVKVKLNKIVRNDTIDKKNADLWLEILNFIEIKKAAQPRPISQNLFGIKK